MIKLTLNSYERTKFIKVAAKRYIQSVVCGSSMTVYVEGLLSSIDDDRRKHKRILRDLYNLGFIEAVDGKTVITDVAFRLLDEESPDSVLLSYLDNISLDHYEGFPFFQLKSAHQKYVVNHLSDYTLATETSYQKRLLITNSVVSVEVDRRKKEAALQNAIERNLAWGLERAGIINEDEEKFFSVDTGRGSFFSTYSIGPDINNWPDEIDKAEEALLKKIDHLKKNLAAVSKAKEGVAKIGWDAFLSDYKNAIIESLSKEES